MKVLSADGSVGLPHVRVGHCQASNTKPRSALLIGVFFWMPYDAEPIAQVNVIRNSAKLNSSPFQGSALRCLRSFAPFELGV